MSAPGTPEPPGTKGSRGVAYLSSSVGSSWTLGLQRQERHPTQRDWQTRAPMPSSRATWFGAWLAMAILGLLMLPWPAPRPEVLIEQFVPGLITVDAKGFLPRPGRVAVSSREIELSAAPHSQPTVHLLTAEVPFTVRFSVSVLDRVPPGAFPFQLKIWNPSSEVALEAWYNSDGTIKAGIRSQATWQQVRRVAGYTVGGAETWSVARHDGRVTVEISTGKDRGVFEVDAETFPDLFKQPSLSLTMFATGPAAGVSRVIVRDPLISVPHQTRYGTTVQSPWYRPTVALTAFLVVCWLVASVRVHSSSPARTLHRYPQMPIWHSVVLSAIIVGTILVGSRLSPVPGYPFDVRSAIVWSQVARQHGLTAIMRHPLLATERDAHGGQPYAAVNFPYPPLLTYLFWTMGKVASAEQTEQTLKMLITLVVVAGGLGIFALLRRLRVTSAVAILAAGAYMLNPAVLFDGVVWGQTDAVVASFLLLAAAGVAFRSAPMIWTSTMLAVLTKQTGVLFMPFLLVLGVVSVGFRQMIRGLSTGIMIVFLAMAPAFAAGVHPSSVFRPLVTKVVEFGTMKGMDGVASQNTFNLWSAIAASEGARGWARLAFPDNLATRFGVSYFLLSRAVFVVLVVFLLAFVLKRRPLAPGAVFLSLAVFGVGAAVLLTRMQARYLYFGLMFTALSLPWMPRRLGPLVLILLSGTMLVAMWGLMASTSIWFPGLLSEFDPARSWLNRFMAEALGSDIGITVGGLLNVIALGALLAALWQNGTRWATFEERPGTGKP